MPTQNKIAQINSEYADKIKAAVDGEIESLKDLLKQVAVIYANVQEAKADVDVWGNKAVAKLLGNIGLAPIDKTTATPKPAKAVKSVKRLRGDNKEGLKPIILAVIKAAKTGVKRGELQSNSGIEKYCSNLGISTVPNLAPVLKEMIKDGDIGRKGDKATAVYLAK